MNTEAAADNKSDVSGRSVLARRAVIGAAAWSVPVITVAAAAPAFAASGRQIVKTTPGEVGTGIGANDASTTQQLSVRVTKNGVGVANRTISFSASPLSGDASTSWLSFAPAVTGADGVATTTLTYGTKPTVNSTYRITALDVNDADLLVIWTLSYTARANAFSTTFDSLASGLPTNFTVRTGATAAVLGTTATPTLTAVAWTNTAGAFKNVASATGLTSTASATDQNSSTNRAIGLRQSGAVGDPGGAFVVRLGPTTGHTSIKVSFRLQSLDTTATGGNAVGRVTPWVVDGGVSTGTNFTSRSTPTPTVSNGGTMSTSVAFKNDIVTVDFGSALDNLSGDVYVRILSTVASTGTGNRPTSAIDDLTVTWN